MEMLNKVDVHEGCDAIAMKKDTGNDSKKNVFIVNLTKV